MHRWMIIRWKATFSCGRNVAETADEVAHGLDPLTHSWCVLRVVKRGGLLLSLDNRRLKAFKMAQEQVRVARQIVVVDTKGLS